MRFKFDSPAGREMYSHSMGTVEPVFGNLQNEGMRRFALRGQRKVSAQWQLFTMVHIIEKDCGRQPKRPSLAGTQRRAEGAAQANAARALNIEHENPPLGARRGCARRSGGFSYSLVGLTSNLQPLSESRTTPPRKDVLGLVHTSDEELDKVVGCLLGLALGDTLGAPYEGGPIERLAWLFMGRTISGRRRWTDDTQMSLDLARSLITNRSLNQDHLAACFAKGYQRSRGYGPGAARTLKLIARGQSWSQANISVFPNGSFGNGAAMRAPIIGLFCRSCPELIPTLAEQSAVITHAHPLAITSAVIVAHTTYLLLHRAIPSQVLLELLPLSCPEFDAKLAVAKRWLLENYTPPPEELRKRLGNSVLATDSVVTAIFIALHCLDKPFRVLLSLAIRVQGDVDTIAAIAGALWGAYNGAKRLEGSDLANLEDEPRLRTVAAELSVASPSSSAGLEGP